MECGMDFVTNLNCGLVGQRTARGGGVNKPHSYFFYLSAYVCFVTRKQARGSFIEHCSVVVLHAVVFRSTIYIELYVCVCIKIYFEGYI